MFLLLAKVFIKKINNLSNEKKELINAYNTATEPQKNQLQEKMKKSELQFKNLSEEVLKLDEEVEKLKNSIMKNQ